MDNRQREGFDLPPRFQPRSPEFRCVQCESAERNASLRPSTHLTMPGLGLTSVHTLNEPIGQPVDMQGKHRRPRRAGSHQLESAYHRHS